MVMTAMQERKIAILAAIRRAGGWVDRAEIATATGKANVGLSPNDVKHLEALVSEGYAEKRTVPGDGIREKFEYKAIEKR